MKFKHITISGLIFSLISFSLHGQGKESEITSRKQPATQYVVGELFTGELQSDTYLNPDWIPGDLLLETGEKISNVDLKYNSLIDELFWREPESNKVIKVDKEYIKGFHFNDFRGDTTVFFRRMKIKKDYVSDSILCYLQEIEFFKIKLFIYHSKFFFRRETFSVNYNTSIRDIYIEQPIYFIKSNTELSVFKKFTRMSLKKAFPDKSDIIMEYLRKSASGRIRTYMEIISFFLYLDSYF
jgi:hypothetical protein